MDLSTSASSEMYKKAFSPGLRSTVGGVTSTDVLVLVLIAILIVYLLAKAFQGPCRTVCQQVCPMDNAEHMTGSNTGCGGSDDGFFGWSLMTPLPCEEIKIEYAYKDANLGNGSYTFKEGTNCNEFESPLEVRSLEVIGTSGLTGITNGCNMSKVKAVLAKSDGSEHTAKAQDVKFVEDGMNANVALAMYETDNIKYWKVKKIYSE